MNFLQLHEQLRLELLRRIERGVLSGTLLARQTGLKAAHISNFLHGKRRLSLDALDRVLASQSITIQDLLAQIPGRHSSHPKRTATLTRIGLVTQTVAMYDAVVRASSVLEHIQLPPGYLDHLRTRRSPERSTWERFVAVRLSYAQAEPMMPILSPHSILVIDRHYNSLISYRPSSLSIYAIQNGKSMLFRYASLHGSNLILRPHRLEHPVELIETTPSRPPGTFIIGRICVSISEV